MNLTAAAPDGLTYATIFLGLVTLVVALATVRLGTRAAEETRAQWRPVLLVRARRDDMDVKIRRQMGQLNVDVENVGRGPALDVFPEGLLGLERESPNISALAQGETATLRFRVPDDAETLVFRLTYGDISLGGYSTTVMIGSGGDGLGLVNQSFDIHPNLLNIWWLRAVPRGPQRRWIFKRAARRRGFRMP